MNTKLQVLLHKESIIKIVKLALETMNNERKKKFSNYNLAQDFKDNLDEDLKTFCDENGFVYKRRGMSQQIIINGHIIKLKMHANLNERKQNVIDKVESPFKQLSLVPECKKIPLFIPDWELGIVLSQDRTKVIKIRLVNFEHEIVELLYNIEDENNLIKNTDSLQETEQVKNNIRSKVSIKERKYTNGI